MFASRRLAINEADLESLNRAERRFYRDALKKHEWTWRSANLFFRDQGRLNYLVHKLSIPIVAISPELICRPGASSISVSFEDIKNDACDYHMIHWMGSKSPSPSFFCAGPLFSVYAFLWANVGRKTGRYVAPGYERLPECTGYSLWRHYYEQSFGTMSLATRLRWSWPDLRRIGKLLIRSFRLLVKSAVAADDTPKNAT
jgi:hypothetical protein